MISQFALEAYTARRDKARDALRNRQVAPDAAERKLRPWAAIALLCGADPAAIHPELPELQAERCTDPGCRLWLLADDLCPRVRWMPLLAKARDRAIAAKRPEAGALIAICDHLRPDINGHVIPPPGPWLANPERIAA